MSTELFWLLLTVGMSGLFWVPYILDRSATRGIVETLGYPGPETPRQSDWAERMWLAHCNAVENPAIFAPLALVAQILNIHTPATAASCVVYFWPASPTFSMPSARTLSFLVGWGAQVILFFAVI